MTKKLNSYSTETKDEIVEIQYEEVGSISNKSVKLSVSGVGQIQK
jgi:hypothetical protein